jgi:hypothetical protein
VLDAGSYAVLSGDAFRQQLMARDSVFYIDREYGEIWRERRSVRINLCPRVLLYYGKHSRMELEAPILFVGSYQDASPSIKASLAGPWKKSRPFWMP